MAQIRFNVSGDVQLSRNLRIAADNISDLKSFHKEAIKIMGKRSDDLFANKWRNVQKNPNWKPLAESTKRARENRWGYYKRPPKNPSTLRWTGRLQEDRTSIATNLYGSLQFNAPYAIYHQKGLGNLPQRAILDLDNRTNSKIVKALQKKIQEDLGVFGRQM